MADNGWIKLHRCLIKSNVFENPMLLKVWIWCLLKASHKGFAQVVGKQIVDVAPGEFITGRRKAALELKMHERTAYDYLKLLEKLHMIDIKSNNRFSIVSVVNWETYQSNDSNFQQQSDTISDTMSDTNNTHKQECKENKEYNNIINNIVIGEKRKQFIPPTVEEVSAYCQERGNGIDANRFVDYYESRGWLIGKNKMKSWKAAVRTWEGNNKDKGVTKVVKSEYNNFYN